MPRRARCPTKGPRRTRTGGLLKPHCLKLPSSLRKKKLRLLLDYTVLPACERKLSCPFGKDLRGLVVVLFARKNVSEGGRQQLQDREMQGSSSSTLRTREDPLQSSRNHFGSCKATPSLINDATSGLACSPRRVHPPKAVQARGEYGCQGSGVSQLLFTSPRLRSAAAPNRHTTRPDAQSRRPPGNQNPKGAPGAGGPERTSAAAPPITIN